MLRAHGGYKHPMAEHKKTTKPKTTKKKATGKVNSKPDGKPARTKTQTAQTKSPKKSAKPAQKPKQTEMDLVPPPPPPPLRQRVVKWAKRGTLGVVVTIISLVLLFSFVRVPTTLTILSEAWRLGGVEREWVRLDDVSLAAQRAVVAAEDANFCLHWGIDARAVRQALEDGTGRGASSISQQTVKNVFLWQGRSWPRKALETAITPLVELTWSKRRILEVYLNVAEMGEGIFGIEAAAQHYFGVMAIELTPDQAARIAAALPAPHMRDPANPSPWMRTRAAHIRDGAATIAADGRSACFED